MAHVNFSSHILMLNNLDDESMQAEFLRCCGSRVWASTMTNSSPFTSYEELIEVATKLWWSLSPDDWLVAFSAHPKIGDKKALKEKFSKSSWEGNEQSGANSASEEVLTFLEQLNDEYYLKNGFVFLICATGKSAEEMLHALRLRLDNDRDTELQIAAGEQDKITKLRLVKLLESLANADNQPINSKL